MPEVTNNKPPIKNSNKDIGRSINFFLFFKKFKYSLKKLNIILTKIYGKIYYQLIISNYNI